MLHEGVPALKAGFGVRGVWQPQTVALINVCVIDTDTLSYEQRSVQDVLALAEGEKRKRVLIWRQLRHVDLHSLPLYNVQMVHRSKKLLFP